jgi:regulator of sigma E protease
MLDFLRNTIITVGSFIIVLSVLMVLHEWGHYIVGRIFKFKIIEFALGLPPRLFTRMRQGIRWSINAIPLMAYVQFAGEDGELDEEGKDENPDHFINKPAWQRLLVLLAGSITHIMLALVLFFILALALGVPHDTDLFPTVYAIDDNSPAQQAELHIDDVFIAVESQRVVTYTQFATLSEARAGLPTTYTVLRDGKPLDLVMTPRVSPPSGEGPIGITPSTYYIVRWEGIPAAIGYSFSSVRVTIINSFEVVGSLVQKLFHGTLPDDIGGPVAIAAVSGEFARSDGLVGIMFLVAILAANLAVINLLPFPGLDGGRIVFVVTEWVRGKKLSLRAEAMAHTIGFALLLTLLVVVTYRDIIRIFT